jgi:hypothetical protein
MRSRIILACVLLAASAGIQAQQACSDRINQSTPTSRFVDNGNGTVTDTRTGLMWQRCLMGFTFSNNGTPSNLADDTCTPSATTTFTWQLGLQEAANRNTQGGFAGFTDWRVANIKELISIVEHRCANPAINATIFPGTPASADIFSSSPGNVGTPTTSALTIATGNGSDGSLVILTAQRSMRLVRAGS